MKTIEESAKLFEQENGERIYNEHIDDKPDGNLCIESFKSGVEFAQRWIPIDEELPKTIEKVLTKLDNGDVIINRYIETSWFNTYKINKITHWRPIEYK